MPLTFLFTRELPDFSLYPERKLIDFPVIGSLTNVL